MDMFKYKAIIAGIALSTMIAAHGISKLDEYSAILWLHYEPSALKSFNAYYARAMMNKADNNARYERLDTEIKNKLKSAGKESPEVVALVAERDTIRRDDEWYKFLPHREQNDAKDVEGRVAMEIYTAVQEGKVLSEQSYTFIKAYEQRHPAQVASTFATSYDSNVTRAARKAQAAMIVVCGSSIAIYKYRAPIMAKFRELKKRLFKKFSTQNTAS